MSTLLKAHLLKSDNPFTMLKCYLEDILKQDKSSWDEVIEGMKNYKPQKKDDIALDPQLVSALEAIWVSEKKEQDKDDDKRKKHEEAERKKHPKDESKRKPYKGREKQLPDIRFIEATGERKVDPSTGESMPETNPFHWKVRMANLIRLTDSLKNSELYSKDASTVKPILQGLDRLMSEVRTKQTPKRKDTPREKERKKITNEFVEDIISIKRNITTSSFDLSGELIYDDSVEDSILDLITSPKAISRLRYLTTKNSIEDAATEEDKVNREKILNLLEGAVEIDTLEGRKKMSLLEAIIYAYQQKTGVILANIEKHPDYLSRKRHILEAANKGGREKIRKMLEKIPDLADRQKKFKEMKESKRRKASADEKEREERGEEFEETRSLMADLLAGKTIEL